LHTNVLSARRKLFLQIWKSGSFALTVEAKFSTSQEQKPRKSRQNKNEK